MHFIGIIAQNRSTVQEIIHYFLNREKNYSILFTCQSIDEYKELPAQNRKKADIVCVDTGTLESCFAGDISAKNAVAFESTTLLTNRESEVAQLVVKGYTNKKIGEALFISTCTVNAHLRKIFSKLSVKSRTELAYRMIHF